MFYIFRTLGPIPVLNNRHFTRWSHMTTTPSPPPRHGTSLYTLALVLVPKHESSLYSDPSSCSPGPRTWLWSDSPPPRHKTSLYRDPPPAPAPTLAQDPLVTKTGDLFKLVHLRTPFCWHLVAAEAHTVSGWCASYWNDFCFKHTCLLIVFPKTKKACLVTNFGKLSQGSCIAKLLSSNPFLFF